MSQEDNDKRIKDREEMESIFGLKKANPWGTSDFEIFSKRLNDMNLRKLKQLAADVGVMGEFGEKGLRIALKKRFKQDSRNYNQVCTVEPIRVNVDLNDPETKKLFNL